MINTIKKLFSSKERPVNREAKHLEEISKAKNTIINKGSVLIGVGCSHTQGCAFTKNELNVEEHELATNALKEKYNTSHVDTKFLTNVSWVGKLGKKMKVDKVYNFGYGGWGIESGIRALRSYCFKVDSLKNHTIVFQIPSPTRKEVTYSSFDKAVPVRVDTVGNVTSFESKAPYKEAFLEHYVDFENIEGNMIYELYFLQDYLELKGAKVRFFDHPFSDWGIQTTNQSDSFKTGYREWFGKSYEKFATELPDLPAVFNKLNLMDLSDFYNKDENYENEGTLHHEGLKKDDAHYSETGNERLAKVIFKRLDKKYSKRIFATLPGVWDLTRNKKKLI